MLSIRSQNKDRLVPYNSMIERDGTNLDIRIHDGVYERLGKYATQERALEVLDEIEEANNDFYKVMNGGINVHELDYTYQMPKE